MKEFSGRGNLEICPCKLCGLEKNSNNKDPYICPPFCYLKASSTARKSCWLMNPTALCWPWPCPLGNHWKLPSSAIVCPGDQSYNQSLLSFGFSFQAHAEAFSFMSFSIWLFKLILLDFRSLHKPPVSSLGSSEPRAKVGGKKPQICTFYFTGTCI